MTRSTATIVIALACLAIVLFALLTHPADESHPGDSTDAGTRTTLDTNDASTDLAPSRPHGAVQRRDTETAPEHRGEEPTRETLATTGAMTLRALWSDGRPAANVTLSIRRNGRFLPREVVLTGVTNEEGLLQANELPPGAFLVRSDRGGELRVDVVAGTHENHDFQLPAGCTVEGRVLDRRDLPVADADVWLQSEHTDWTGGAIVGHADGEGRFTLHGIPTGMSLAAVAAGHAPSALVDLDTLDTSQSPVHVELVLEDGAGSIEGRVLNSAGEPIAAAVIAVGTGPSFMEPRGPERWVERWTPRTTRTNEEGAFALPGIPTGSHPIAVRATDHGIWRSNAVVEDGARTWLEVTLAASVIVQGIVTDVHGEPMVGALVHAYDVEPKTRYIQTGQIDFDETFDHVASETDAKGAYRLVGVTPGDVQLIAQARPTGQFGVSVPFTRTILRAAPGDTLTWNPTITDGRTIEGVVLYQDGAPMANVFVTAKDEGTGPEHVLVTNGQGKFRFIALEGLTYSLHVQYWTPPKGTPPLERYGVIPGSGLVELRAPFDAPVEEQPGKITGRFADVHDRVPHAKALKLSLVSDQHWWRENPKLDEGGTFTFDEVKPGRYRIVALAHENAVAQQDWFDLRAGETKDIGVLRTAPAGSLIVRLERDGETLAVEPKLYFTLEGWSRGTTVEIGRRSEVTLENLTVGHYTLTGHASGMASLKGETDIVAGQQAELSLRLQAAALQKFEIHFPGDEPLGALTLSVKSSTGVLFLSEDYPADRTLPRPFTRTLRIPRGTWTMEATTDTGLRGSAAFRIDTLEGASPIVRVETKRAE
ncbi:MAG: carboxypeptidase regulatory-like domain-containing protein [Planctomycetes bacterium]|nr:carboxypeptidase regulatory-like domain-containing protein [Planctomycetota bacterium]